MKQYKVTGMSCAACSARVEKAVSKVSGVKSCAVSLLTNSMGVEGDASSESIIAAVKSAGYGATLVGGKATETNIADKDVLDYTETHLIKKRFISSLVFLTFLMYISMGFVMWGFPLPSFLEDNLLAIGLIQLLLTAVIMVINQKFFVSGFKGLINRAPNMDTLVSLGAGAAFIYSTYVIFQMTFVSGDIGEMRQCLNDLYFESSAMILTLITLGKLLESRSKSKTTDALKTLMSLEPQTATVFRNGEEIIVPIEQVKVGDKFIVRPGEIVPVDGVVIDGNSAVNESALTGESIPVDKEIGDNVSAATFNQSGVLKCEATRVGEDTTLSQIFKMVSDAAASKAPVSKVADRVSAVFVPVVLGISIITFSVWMFISRGEIGFSLARAISVLVISCPCALGLATPVAIMVGNGIGAKNGILFKTATALEVTGKIDTVVLDKTGTLTKGEPLVTDIVSVNGVSMENLLKYAYALEKNSEHPLARAVIKKAEELKLNALDVTEFRAVAGNGLSAVYKGKHLVGGNLNFIQTYTDISEEIKAKAEEISIQGKTPIYFSYSGELLGIIAVSDVLKEDSSSAVRELQNMGIHVVMLTGDNEKTAKAVGRQAGVDEIIAGVLPDGKESVIRNLQKNSRVAMVGDGINDTPALTRADVGIAIGAGTDIAIDAADVVLMKSTLSDVPAAIRLSNATLRGIHQNLFWAFFYNVIGIPISAGVFVPLGLTLNPMIAAAAMSFSSLFVVTNALRLNLIDIYGNRKCKKENIKKGSGEKIMEKTMKIEGMMCAHCEARVKETLEALEAVELAVVSHVNGTAVLTLKSEISNDELKNIIEKQDYKVISVE